MSAPTHTLADVPIASIRVIDGFNPRRHFNAAAMSEMVESIKLDGVISPITVRRHEDDSLSLIAGERRLRASREIGLESIPAKVIVCSDVDAKRMALKENLDRQDLSVAEEAISARDYLNLYEGDIQLARNDLGWSEQKFRARLLLLQASPAVLDALGEGRLSAGHAELLSALPHANQDKALPQIIESAMTVTQLKDMLRGFVIPLSTAIFDLDGCRNCPRNSETQRDFFSNTVDGANCQDRACFKHKTEAAIAIKEAALLEEVSTVGKVSEKPPGTYTLLMRDGKNGVGATQFSACRACKHFGALLHDQLNARCGQVDRPACFDVACNATKIAAHAAELAAETTVPPAMPAASSRGKAPAGKSIAAGKKVTSRKVAGVAQTSGPVREHISEVFRNAASALMDADGRSLLAVAIVAIAGLPGNGAGGTLIEGAMGGTKRRLPSIAAQIAALSQLPQAELAALVKSASKSFIASVDATPVAKAGLETAVRLAQAHAVDYTAHFAMNEAFLASHTLAGIEALLDESGFTTWLAGQNDGAARAKALKGKKKADLPAAVMAEGFDWSGFVPGVIRAATPEALTR